MKNVLLLTGAGQIGMAIARRMGYGMKIVVGDKYLLRLTRLFTQHYFPFLVGFSPLAIKVFPDHSKPCGLKTKRKRATGKSVSALTDSP